MGKVCVDVNNYGPAKYYSRAETGVTTSDGSDNEAAVHSSSATGGSRSGSPARSLGDSLKVPPLKIILPAANSTTDVKTRVHESVHSARQVWCHEFVFS